MVSTPRCHYRIPDHVDLRFGFQHRAKPLAGERFIIHDQRANLHGWDLRRANFCHHCARINLFQLTPIGDSTSRRPLGPWKMTLRNGCPAPFSHSSKKAAIPMRRSELQAGNVGWNANFGESSRAEC